MKYIIEVIVEAENQELAKQTFNMGNYDFLNMREFDDE